MTPTSHVIELYLNIFETAVSAEPIATIDLQWSINQYHLLEEIMHDIVVRVKAFTGKNLVFNYGFDQSTGELTMTVLENTIDETVESRYFQFYDNTGANTDHKSFLRFLNQQETTANINILSNKTDLKSFNGVWDRTTLFFHASFSKSHRNIIGRNKDFWTTPSKKYVFTDNTNDFYVYFTTNGVHRIFPYYCNFYLELTFILNYEHSIV